jgi:hypothetical protein
LFQVVAFAIHLYKASCETRKNFPTSSECGQSQTIIVKAASVFSQYLLSFTQKSNFTTSPFLNTIFFDGTQCTTQSFTLIQRLAGKPYTHLNQHKTLYLLQISPQSLSTS